MFRAGAWHRWHRPESPNAHINKKLKTTIRLLDYNKILYVKPRKLKMHKACGRDKTIYGFSLVIGSIRK